MEERDFKLECGKCGAQRELPENIGLDRLFFEGDDFYRNHKKENRSCEGNVTHLFIRTFY